MHTRAASALLALSVAALASSPLPAIAQRQSAPPSLDAQDYARTRVVPVKPPASAGPSLADRLTAKLFLAVSEHDASALREALRSGADPNGRDFLGFTPLEWASVMRNGTAVRALVARGARVNDETMYGSALTGAALSGDDAIGLFLLDHGAGINPPRFDRTTPLIAAAGSGAPGIVRRLLRMHADPDVRNDERATALIAAARRGQTEAASLLLHSGARVNAADSTNRTPLHYAAIDGHSALAAVLLAHGASPNAVDASGATPLHLAARYSGDPETVRLLLRAGAQASRRDARGRTPYELATHRGYAAAASLLRIPATASTVAAPGRWPASAGDATTASLLSIQTGMRAFAGKALCASCHHQGLGLMTIAMAARHQLPVDGRLIGQYMGQLAEDGKQGAAATHAAAVDPSLAPLVPAVEIGDFCYGGAYFLGALRAGGVPANPGLADAALVIGGLQQPDGSWHQGMQRGTMEDSYFTTTALVLDVLNAYWPADRKADLDRRLAHTRAWLAGAKPRTAEDAAARLWALKSAGADDAAIADAARSLVALQAADGGWDSATAPRSDAYTTGIAIYALRLAGGMAPADAPIRRAVAYLIRTQDEDGSWYASKATSAYNNHFDAGFPHGHAQYASFAATCWATMGLMTTMQPRAASLPQ